MVALCHSRSFDEELTRFPGTDVVFLFIYKAANVSLDSLVQNERLRSSRRVNGRQGWWATLTERTG